MDITSESFLPHDLITKITTKISKQTLHPGLYIVSTPIGNIFDISFRAVFILKNSYCIFAEDTRVAAKLFSFYEIKKKAISCNNFTETKHEITKKIIENKDKVFSIISDAGTPLISDPGYKLSQWCIENGINIYPVPGACSAIAGLTVSGLPTDRFYFYGFLSNKASQRKKNIESLRQIYAPIIFLESPNRLVDSLIACADSFGNVPCFVGRELTKLFEEHKRGYLFDVIQYYQDNPPLGEVVFIIDNSAKDTDINSNIDVLLNEKLQVLSLKDAVKAVQQQTGLSRKLVYELALKKQLR